MPEDPGTPRKKPDRMELLARGILIGGSVGVLASLAGVMDMQRAAVLGALCGVLAVLTRKAR